MPNYGLVVTPQYNPMSYEQYAKPFKEYGKAYNAMADAYDTLEMEANQWEKLAQNAKDKPQYDQYKKYADDLRSAANDLASNGLNQRTRGTLSNLRKRYSQEIEPINQAYQLRLEDIKTEDALIAKDPSLVLAQSARDRGLGAYMTGIPQRFGVSGEDVYSRSLAATKAITDAMHLTPEERNAFRGFYYDFVTRVGEPDAELAYEYIRSMGVDDEAKAQSFGKYVAAINDVLASTNFNQLSDEGKNRIYNYAVNGAITGIGYDEKHQLLRSPLYDNSINKPVPSVPERPAVSTPIIREAPKSKKKDSTKVREDLNSNRTKVQSPWAEGSRSASDKFAGRFKEDSPVKTIFNTPNEAEEWADRVIAQIDSYFKSFYKGNPEYIPAEERPQSINIEGVPVKAEDVESVLRSAKELKDRIAKYREQLDPYSRTLGIDNSKFATDQQLAAIAEVQHNTGARQNITFNLESLDEEDRKARKAKYSQIVKGVRNYDKKDSRGLYEIDEKKNKLTKVTSSSEYDNIIEDGDLVYSTEYGMVIQSGDKLYLPKNNPDVDEFNKSNKAIIQALNFDNSLYKLEGNQVEDSSNKKLENLTFTRDGEEYINPQSKVYSDRNITIYEGLDDNNEVRRIVVDNATQRTITSISLLEATTGEAFLAGSDYQRGINEWWRQALRLENIANDSI